MADDPMSPEAVREEVGRAMTDAAHPQHQNWQAARRGDTKGWDAWSDGLYKRIPPGTEVSTTLGDFGLSAGGETREHAETADDAETRARQEVILAPLRQEWGGEFDATFAYARAEARELFAEQADQFRELADRIAGCGPQAETLAIRFLADLAKLRKGG